MILKNKTIVAVLFLIATIPSCTVDRISETTLSDPSFWSTEAELRLAANFFYTKLPSVVAFTDNWSDDACGLASNTISDGWRLVPSTDGGYNGNYSTIRAVNNFLEKAPKALTKGVATERVNWYVGEAKYFRAWAYFQLLQRYGGVPLILKTLGVDAPELQAAQASREEVLNAIYADLDDAVLMLRTARVLGATNYGRVSKTAALTLKAQVGLFEGTRSKYHNYGNPIKHLTIARDASAEVMLSAEHTLWPNYFQLLQYEGEGFANKENILVKQYGSAAVEVLPHNSPRVIEGGASNPTKALADSYLMLNGLPITNSLSEYVEPKRTMSPQPIQSSIFVNRDPRMAARFHKAGDLYKSTSVFISPPLNTCKTGFSNRCYSNPLDWFSLKCYIDHPITRYAEVLLINAEAIFELNGSITDGELNATINLLRTRASASMAKLTNAFVTTNGLSMRDEIRRERRVELALEGFRYWDLIRWKTAEIELPKPILGSFYYSDFTPRTNLTPINENGYLKVFTVIRKFDPARDYLFPFPTIELGLNQQLKQNPGWQ